ncbi:tyrosine-protein phosphatase [Rummeliibacillus sp. JY-2-4R]
MIDLHSHILFGVDDGPSSEEESIQMLEQAVKEGITGIVSTSHAKQPQYHVDAIEVKNQLDKLQKELEKRRIPLTLYQGHEIRLHERIIPGIVEEELLTLADSKYLLLELPSQNVPHYVFSVVNQLLSNNIIPIIAHPERNKGIAEKPELLAKLVCQGAMGQVTTGSLCGHFGRGVQKVALELLDANLVHTIGSDAHNLDNRPFLFNKCLTYLEKRGLGDYIDILLENNERVITNRDVILLEPETPKKKAWWKIGV